MTPCPSLNQKPRLILFINPMQIQPTDNWLWKNECPLAALVAHEMASNLSLCRNTATTQSAWLAEHAVARPSTAHTLQVLQPTGADDIRVPTEMIYFKAKGEGKKKCSYVLEDDLANKSSYKIQISCLQNMIY